MFTWDICCFKVKGWFVFFKESFLSYSMPWNFLSLAFIKVMATYQIWEHTTIIHLQCSSQPITGILPCPLNNDYLDSVQTGIASFTISFALNASSENIKVCLKCIPHFLIVSLLLFDKPLALLSFIPRKFYLCNFIWYFQPSI